MRATEPSGSSRSLSAAVAHHRRAMVLSILVFAVLGAALAFVGGRRYTTTTDLLVQALPGNAYSPTSTGTVANAQLAVQFEARLVGSLPVTALVNKDLGSRVSASSLQLSASAQAASQVIQISVTADSARAAARYAQSYAANFLRYRAELATTAQQAQVRSLDQQTAGVRSQLASALADHGRTNAPADTTTKIRQFTSRLADLDAKIGAAQAPAGSPGQIVGPPAPGQASNTAALLKLLGAIVLGALIALGWAVWREFTDGRIRAGTVQTIAGAPVLAVVDGVGADATTTDEDALRRTRTELLAVAGPNSVIALAGVSPGSGPYGIAHLLARSFARAGYRIALVDATVSGSQIILDADLHARGLSDILADGHLGEIELTEVDGVHVLTAGTDPLGDHERYSGKVFGQLISHLRETHDYLLIDAAPVLTGDGMAVLRLASLVVLVAEDRRTTYAAITQAHIVLERLGTTLAGLLAVRPAETSAEVAKPARRTARSEHRFNRRKDEARARLETPTSGEDQVTGAHSGFDDLPGEVPDPGSTADLPEAEAPVDAVVAEIAVAEIPVAEIAVAEIPVAEIAAAQPDPDDLAALPEGDESASTTPAVPDDDQSTAVGDSSEEPADPADAAETDADPAVVAQTPIGSVPAKVTGNRSRASATSRGTTGSGNRRAAAHGGKGRRGGKS